MLDHYHNKEKYGIIAYKFGPDKRGSYISSTRMAKYYPNNLEFIELSNIHHIDDIRSQYKGIILRTQFLHKYSQKWRLSTGINDIIFCRDNSKIPITHSCTNGFSYYKNHPKIKYFIPQITDLENYKDVHSPDNIVLGFMLRSMAYKHTFRLITDFLLNIKYPIEIYTMGNLEYSFNNFPNIIKHSNTYDSQIFFNNITHYIYICDPMYEDPFPNTLMEAVQCNKQIIVLNKSNRQFQDGCDDILFCIKYHNNELNYNKILDNSDFVLKKDNFDSFYKTLFLNNFEYTFNRLKYNSFYEWCYHEL